MSNGKAKTGQKQRLAGFVRTHKALLSVLAIATTVVIACVILLPPFIESLRIQADVEPISPVDEPTTQAPRSITAAYLEINTDTLKTLDETLAAARAIGIRSVYVPAHIDNKAIYQSSHFESYDSNSYLSEIVKKAHNAGMTVTASVDPLLMPDGSQYDISKIENAAKSAEEIANICKTCGVDSVLLRLSQLDSTNPSYAGYSANGGLMEYELYAQQALRAFIDAVAAAVRTSGGGVCVGAAFDITESVAAKQTLDSIDYVLALNTLESADSGTDQTDAFAGYAEQWINEIGSVKPVYFDIRTDLAATGEIDVTVLENQLETMLELGNDAVVASSLSALINGGEEFDKLRQILMSFIDESAGIKALTVTSPSSHSFTTYSDTVGFIGASDPDEPLTLNGKQVERSKTGYFSVDVKLEPGKNEIVLVHKGVTDTYTVTYNKVLIKSIMPDTDSYYNGSASITVSVVALEGCTLKARIGSDVVEMSYGNPITNDAAENFVSYTASFTMPPADDVPKEVGTLIITAVRNGESETKSGGLIIVRAKESSSSQTTSSTASQAYESGYGIQVGVGDRYVAEVATYLTETLDIITPTDERSRPTNAYLPQGTVDYCDAQDSVFHNAESGNTNSFRNLRYGKRVYSDKNIKIFKATLPETNTVTAVSAQTRDRHTVLTLDVAWKAPFNVTLSPQTYKNPYPSNSRPDYSITQTTYEYVDIEFCYTVSGQGKVEFDEASVFSHAEWIKCESGNYGLRLWLKEKGEFYGWTAEYNEDNQLEFYFLNPFQAKTSMNGYGYALTGAVIVVDAGHGGADPGAVGSSKYYTEATLNLIQARKIQRELENLGATVIMTRTDDTSVTLDERTKLTAEIKPDIFISVHRNASTNTATRGYENYYFHPFSKALADSVHKYAAEQFTDTKGVKFYPFYVTRTSCCPAILTENGFMSNRTDLEMIKRDSHNEALATATVQGIVDYFASIRRVQP